MQYLIIDYVGRDKCHR